MNIFKIIPILLFIYTVHANHFQGGTITYKVLDTYGSVASVMITQTYLYKWPTVYCTNALIVSQGTPNLTTYSDYNAKLNCIANCSTSGGYTPLPVRPYCIDYSPSMAISSTQRTDIVNLTIGAYFQIAFQGYAVTDSILIIFSFHFKSFTDRLGEH